MSAVGFPAPHVFHLCHPIYEWAAFIFCAAHFRICFAVANSFQPRCIFLIILLLPFVLALFAGRVLQLLTIGYGPRYECLAV